MKVFFNTSVRNIRFYKKNIKDIYRIIKSLGYKHVSDFVIKVDPKKFYEGSPEESESFYREIVSGIKEADICVFEISLDSAGVGYSVNLALDSGKPVIVLHVPDRIPYLLQMIRSHPKIQVLSYKASNLKGILKNALESAKDQTDIRFTFFLTPKLVEYLDFVKRVKKTARATLLRRLIEGEMKKDKEFLSKRK